MTNALETHRLRKEFGPKVAVSDLTLAVRQGEIFGFLGPNGAGKTTSVKMMLGLVRPSSGEGTLLGHDIGSLHARARAGFLPEHFRFHDWLNGREFLSYHGRLCGLGGSRLRDRSEALLKRVDLLDVGDRPLRQYSKGMLQRIGLAMAMINDPLLVFLDEPTSGLDPIGRLMVRDILRDMRAAGTTVFLNSHLLSEVEVTCDRVVFIRQGEVVREADLHARAAAMRVEVRVDRPAEGLVAGLAAFGSDVHADGATARLTVADEAMVPAIAAWVVSQQVGLCQLTSGRPTLEEMFLEALGNERAG